MASQNILKRSIVRLLKHRVFGVPAAMACQAIGAEKLRRKISFECGHVPSTVQVDLPSHLADKGRFLMAGVGGLDQVARIMHWHGWDGYEKPMPDLFAATSRDTSCVLDVGSYTGFFSMIAATCSPKAEIYAFEPFPTARGWIEKNLAMNHLADRIHIAPVAVNDEAGEANLYVPTTNTGLMETASSLNAEFRGMDHLDTIKVEMVVLDDYLESHQAGPVGLMKIDVESLEHRVLRGARKTLKNDRPYVFVEILEGADVDAIDEVRRDADYLSGILHPGGIRWEVMPKANAEWHDHILCPIEKKGRIEELARAMGYVCSEP